MVTRIFRESQESIDDVIRDLISEDVYCLYFSDEKTAVRLGGHIHKKCPIKYFRNNKYSITYCLFDCEYSTYKRLRDRKWIADIADDKLESERKLARLPDIEKNKEKRESLDLVIKNLDNKLDAYNKGNSYLLTIAFNQGRGLPKV